MLQSKPGDEPAAEAVAATAPPPRPPSPPPPLPTTERPPTDATSVEAPTSSATSSSSAAGSPPLRPSASHASLLPLDEASLTALEASVRQSRTVDDFTRILGEFRSGRGSSIAAAAAAANASPSKRSSLAASTASNQSSEHDEANDNATSNHGASPAGSKRGAAARGETAAMAVAAAARSQHAAAAADAADDDQDGASVAASNSPSSAFHLSSAHAYVHDPTAAASSSSSSTAGRSLRRKGSNVSMLTIDSAWHVPPPPLPEAALDPDLARNLDRAQGRRAASGSAAAAGDGRGQGISGGGGGGVGGGGAAGGSDVLVKCACCCGRGMGCEVARRATRDWEEMEEDLRLAAEIGQALLRRNDALVASSQAAHAKHISQRDSLMRRLTASIRESGSLERKLAQCQLNLEASDSSNRTLLHELDETRRQLAKLKVANVKSAGMDARARRAEQEADDARQELEVQRRRAEQAESRAKKSARQTASLGEELHAARREVKLLSLDGREARRGAAAAVDEEAIRAARRRLSAALTKGEQGGAHREAERELVATLEGVVQENESLRAEQRQLRELLDMRNEELQEAREAQLQRSDDHDVVASQLRGAPPQGSSTFADSFDAGRDEASSAPPAGHGSSADLATPTALDDEVVMAEERGNDDEREQQGEGQQTKSPQAAGVPPEQHPKSSASKDVRPGAHGTFITPSGTEASFGSVPATGASSSAKHSQSGGDDASSASASSAAVTPNSVPYPAPRSTSQYSETRDSRSTDSSTAPTTPTLGGASALAPDSRRDTRTAQLATLLDYVQRLFSRLSSADVDTLAKRLRRQHLAGDVGHLARTTVNAILRDVDGLRDHFRRALEAEARSAARDDTSGSGVSGGGGKESDSLVSRREFFALLKLVRDVFFEMAKLRNAVNEVQMQPHNAARVLSELLGAAEGMEDKGLGAWFGRLFSGGGAGAGAGVGGVGGLPGAQALQGVVSQAGGLPAALSGAAAAAVGAGVASSSSPAQSGGAVPGAGVAGGGGSGGSGLGKSAVLGRSVSGGPAAPSAPRASAAVTSTATVVEVKGLGHAAATAEPARSASPAALSSSPPGGGGLRAGPRAQVGRTGPHSLTRAQSRNLSGLFAGSLGAAGGDGWDLVEASEALSSAASSGGAKAGPADVLRRQRGGGVVGDVPHHAPSSHRLSRIVDDDEVSIREGFVPERTLRPRGLSDSSIRSTFLEQEPMRHGAAEGVAGAGAGNDGAVRSAGRAPLHGAGRSGTAMAAAPSGAPPSRAFGGGLARGSPITRLITPSTLALQASSSHAGGERRGGGNGVTAGAAGGRGDVFVVPGTAASTSSSASLGFSLPSLRPRGSSAALSLAAAQATAGGIGAGAGGSGVGAGVSPAVARRTSSGAQQRQQPPPVASSSSSSSAASTPTPTPAASTSPAPPSSAAASPAQQGKASSAPLAAAAAPAATMRRPSTRTQPPPPPSPSSRRDDFGGAAGGGMLRPSARPF